MNQVLNAQPPGMNVSPAVAASNISRMGPPTPYQQLSPDKMQTAPIPSGMPNATRSLAELQDAMQRSQAMPAGTSITSASGLTMRPELASDYAKRIQATQNAAIDARARDSIAAGATGREAMVNPTEAEMKAITQASVNAIGGLPAGGGGTAQPQAPAGKGAGPKSIEDYMRMITGGDPNQLGFNSPETRAQAINLMQHDKAMESQRQMATEHRQTQLDVEKMKAASQEKIAGMHYGGDKDQKHIDQVSQQAEMAYRHEMTKPGITEEQARNVRNSIYELGDIDPTTGKRMTPEAAKKLREGKDSATSKVKAGEIIAKSTDPTTKAIKPDELVNQFTALKGDPGAVKALIDKIKSSPDFEQQMMKPLIQQLGYNAKLYQGANESILTPFQHQGITVEPDLSRAGTKAHVAIATAPSRAVDWIGRQLGYGSSQDRASVIRQMGGMQGDPLERIGAALTPGETTYKVTTPGGRTYNTSATPSDPERATLSDDERRNIEMKVRNAADLIKAIEDAEKR
jgi:hypothetical protein